VQQAAVGNRIETVYRSAVSLMAYEPVVSIVPVDVTTNGFRLDNVSAIPMVLDALIVLPAMFKRSRPKTNLLSPF
jgi:hypothetical protein